MRTGAPAEASAAARDAPGEAHGPGAFLPVRVTILNGRPVWLRILEAVKELTATKPAGRVH